MKTLLLTTLAAFAVAGLSLAGSKETITDINAALVKAKAENKMLFLQFGREACGNCQALKGMISKNTVQLPPSKFVYADVNCDDPATSKVFKNKFYVRGDTLPFVVIASPDGAQLAGRSGYGTAAEYQKLIKDAEKAVKKR